MGLVRTASRPHDEHADAFSVSDYLDLLNGRLAEAVAKVTGEIADLQEYDRYLFFSLRDKRNGSILRCFMGIHAYRLSGVKIEDGLEVIAHGHPAIYKQRGNMTFQTELLELVGEGALKKAYDELKRKLEAEGLFDPARKRPLPQYPQKIGVVTSRSGAVIGDFLSNIGSFGYQTYLVDSKVEGQAAVKDLLGAVRTFRKKDIDVLVLMRGGGSLESFLAFNNETLVREIAAFPVPVVAGIGHDKDVCLVALAADAAVSTPTAVAELLNRSWNQALSRVLLAETRIVSRYERALSEAKMRVAEAGATIKERFGAIFERFRGAEEYFMRTVVRIDRELARMRDLLHRQAVSMVKLFEYKFVAHTRHALAGRQKELSLNDPRRQLRLGYSIAMRDGKIVKSIAGLRPEDALTVKVEDGDIDTKVHEIHPHA